MQARTGVSIVTIGSTPVDFDRSRDFVGAVSVCRDTDVPGLVKLSQVVHRYGAKLSVELCHAGPIADKGYLKGKKAFVPSVLPGMQDAEEISKEEMQKVKEAFVSCAVRVKNAGFDQIFNLYSPIVYETGDIIDTYVYRLGIQQAQYSVGAAIGLFKSVVSCIMVGLSYILADKLAGYRIF